MARRLTMRKEEHALYSTWRNMRNRCNLVSHPDYPRYGARGISVCERWLVFENFVADMGLKPEGTTLDRRRNNGNYEPGNCRWATRAEQARNRRTNIMVTRNGETMCLRDWTARLNLPYHLIKKRIRRLGWAPEDALTIPINHTQKGKR